MEEQATELKPQDYVYPRQPRRGERLVELNTKTYDGGRILMPVPKRNGNKECARRVRQMERDRAKAEARRQVSA